MYCISFWLFGFAPALFFLWFFQQWYVSSLSTPTAKTCLNMSQQPFQPFYFAVIDHNTTWNGNVPTPSIVQHDELNENPMAVIDHNTVWYGNSPVPSIVQLDNLGEQPGAFHAVIDQNTNWYNNSNGLSEQPAAFRNHNQNQNYQCAEELIPGKSVQQDIPGCVRTELSGGNSVNNFTNGNGGTVGVALERPDQPNVETSAGVANLERVQDSPGGVVENKKQKK